MSANASSPPPEYVRRALVQLIEWIGTLDDQKSLVARVHVAGQHCTCAWTQHLHDYAPLAEQMQLLDNVVQQIAECRKGHKNVQLAVQTMTLGGDASDPTRYAWATEHLVHVGANEDDDDDNDQVNN